MLSSEMPDTTAAIEPQKISWFEKWWSKQSILRKLIVHQVWTMCFTVGVFYQAHVVQGFRAPVAASQTAVGLFLSMIIVYLAFAKFIGTSGPIIKYAKDSAVLSLGFVCFVFSAITLKVNGLSFERVVTLIAIPLACAWAMKHLKEQFDYHVYYWIRDDGEKRTHILFALAAQFILTSSLILWLPGTFDNL